MASQEGGKQIEPVGRQLQVAEGGPGRLDLQAITPQKRRIERDAAWRVFHGGMSTVFAKKSVLV